ncbi:EcsC protein family protein [Thalassovita gelatinovora]|uniref:EcsC protein family protein n=1 Tax=Thalassovita gelatinovora TaxID=53501 RepID=A0A0P1F821_THAGE|nr:EcsC family protein [Thalassovita gelatinovora]QIZ80284.1 EcsC family protein [Thalassovita gelatinovora]CUH64173.1 EcsC protein family protein [Thalassovita gelatinovora]SEQ84841.1 EcsC protein family protein [Thalassovita gelatinovora]
MLIENAATEIVDLEAELDQLALRYRKAGGLGIQVLNMIGGQADQLLDRLPESIRGNLDGATETALGLAMKAAHRSRGVIGDQPGWLNTTVTTAMGAAGGFGGLPSAMAELPVTTTILLRSIQGVAAEQGFDPAAENVQFDCIRVFASAGPLDHDDGADLAFLTSRMTLRGASLQALIAKIAPRLANVLGQKLAAQAVPVLGAMAGAATNYAYTSYYQDMAHVHFRLRRLAIEADTAQDQLVDQLRQRVTPRVSES